MLERKKNIYPTNISKHSSNHEKLVILLMIPNEEGWFYIAAKNYKHYKENKIKKK